MAGVEFLTPEREPGDDLAIDEQAGSPRDHRRQGRGRASVVAGILVAAVLVAAVVRAATSGDRHAVAAASSTSAFPSTSAPEPVVPPPDSATACRQRVLCEFVLVLPHPALTALRHGFPGVHMDSSRSVVVVDDTHQPYLLTRDAAGTIRTANGTVQLALHVAQPSSADPSGTIYDGDARFGRFSFTRRTHGFTVTIAVTGPGRALPSVLTVSQVADDPDLLVLA
jgi:hypothetical protein